MTARCECCDLPVYSCGKAGERKQHAEARAEVQRLTALGFFPAEHPGRCGHCGEWFKPGWVAACCAERVGSRR